MRPAGSSTIRASVRRRARGGATPSLAMMEQWKLEDAKARFSEVVRLAGTEGPQLVTVRGKEAAVILAPDEYRQLLPRPKRRESMARFLQSLDLGEIRVEREDDRGREIDL